MKSKEEAERLIEAAWNESVTRTGFKNRVLQALDEIYAPDTKESNPLNSPIAEREFVDAIQIEETQTTQHTENGNTEA